VVNLATRRNEFILLGLDAIHFPSATPPYLNSGISRNIGK
jgi:hypothetical protein